MSASIVQEQEDLEVEHQYQHQPPRSKRWKLWLILIAILGGAIYFIQRGIVKNHAAAAEAAAKTRTQSVPVTVFTAKRNDIPVYLDGLGSVTPFNTVTVKTRVDGQLIKLLFQEGQMVHEGEQLAQIDPRPFQVQLEQAQGQLAKDEAQLQNAKIDLDRYQLLIKQDAIPQQQVATQAATVAQLQGTIESDKAAINNAKLQLTYCRITAPISGRIGLRLVDVGNIVHASDANGMIVITQVQPVSVLFTLPEDNLPPVLNKLRSGDRLAVDAYDRSGTTRIASGSLSTVDNQIDPSTGTLKLKAVFENQDNALFPNQFVNVKLLIDVKKNAVVIPVVAIQRGPQGTFVYVVRKDNTVEVRSVVPGSTNGNDTAINKGLSEKEKVVIEGVDKLREGSSVRMGGDEGHNVSRRSSR